MGLSPPTKPSDDGINILTPYSSTYSSSNDGHIESSLDCNGSFSSLCIGDIINDSDDEEVDSDSIPLIDRMTPPPPLYHSDAAQKYLQYQCLNGLDSEHKESEHFQFHDNLSINIPSLNLSDSEPK